MSRPCSLQSSALIVMPAKMKPRCEMESFFTRGGDLLQSIPAQTVVGYCFVSLPTKQMLLFILVWIIIIITWRPMNNTTQHKN